MTKRNLVEVWLDDGLYDMKLETIYGMALHGLNRDQIGRAIGCSGRMLNNFANPNSEYYDEGVSNALKKGNEDLYYGCISFQHTCMTDPKIPLDVRLQLAEKFEKRYRHRYALEVDKQDEKLKDDYVKRVFIIGGEEDEKQ